MGKSWRLLAMVVVLVLTASACKQAKEATPGKTSSPSTEAAKKFHIQVDGQTDKFNAAFTVFFPNTLTVHPGDSVDFELSHFNGEPHTVGLGTLVDAGVKKIKELGGPQPGFAEEGLPEIAKLPDVFPHAAGEGPPSPNQSAAQPCFLDTGEPPGSVTGGAPACEKKDQPEFNGTQSFFNSGMMNEDGANFTVKFSKSIKPGEYGLMCMVHRAAMMGTITVGDPGGKIQTQSDLNAKAQSELKKRVDALEASVKQSANLPADKAVAGVGSETVMDALVAEFGPKDLTIKKGATVTWNGFLFHTIGINLPEDAVGLFTQEGDVWNFNPKAGAPANSNGQPPEYSEFPQRKNLKPITVDGGKYDGSGFKHSGLIASLPPNGLAAYKVTFTKEGTYNIRCAVHPDMKEKVTVTS